MADVKKSMEAAHAAQASLDNFHTALYAFQLACQRGDFKAAEAQRLVTVSSLEAYLDNIAVAHRASQG